MMTCVIQKVSETVNTVDPAIVYLPSLKCPFDFLRIPLVHSEHSIEQQIYIAILYVVITRF